VWLGAHRGSTQISRQFVRDLFKRSLVWAQGYALYAEYPKSIILFMDDFGTSDRTYLPYWHYRTLNEEDIRKGLIGPLKRHHAVLNQDILTGYVDRKARRIVNPSKQQVIDEIDGKTLHDYVSAKRGLDAGLHEGVFEIQCHGYTHMLPDLESPPGPFWTAPMDGTGTLGFDVEFGDELRNKEVPAITQKFLLSRGIENIRKDFGVTPLFVINGGGAWSKTYPNNSPRIAAEMGFGLSNFGSPGYLGIDLVISPMEPVVQRTTWAYDRKLSGADIPWTMDAPYFIIFHDRDISLDITAAERLLTSLGNGVRYLSANEYCGYLHASIERPAVTGGAVVRFRGRFQACHKAAYLLRRFSWLDDVLDRRLRSHHDRLTGSRAQPGDRYHRLSTEPHAVAGFALLRPHLAVFHVDDRNVSAVLLRQALSDADTQRDFPAGRTKGARGVSAGLDESF